MVSGGTRRSTRHAGSPEISRPSPTLSSLQRSSLNGVTSPHSMSSGPHSVGEVQEEPQTEESLAGRKLVILGIPWETHAETLKTYFGQFGVVQVGLIGMPASMFPHYVHQLRSWGTCNDACCAMSMRKLQSKACKPWPGTGAEGLR